MSRELSSPTGAGSCLRLCLCPLCLRGADAFRDFPKNGVISWIFILRAIIFSLQAITEGEAFFSLKGDIIPFIYQHWHIFSSCAQCCPATSLTRSQVQA